jgi:polysaccharide export outer membrane protein
MRQDVGKAVPTTRSRHPEIKKGTVEPMRHSGFILLAGAAALLSGCASGGDAGKLPSAAFVSAAEGPGADYMIGPLDALQIFVWRNPELSTNVTVRPDGRITVPLIEDLAATGKTPTQLADDIEKQLGTYIQNPIVSVIVGGFNGPFAQQVRIVGQATKPAALPYRSNMTLLDAMIAVGGLTEFAAGDRARLIRFDKATGRQSEYKLRIESLLEDGRTSANVKLEPGDVILIPESFF